MGHEVREERGPVVQALVGRSHRNNGVSYSFIRDTETSPMLRIPHREQRWRQGCHVGGASFQAGREGDLARATVMGGIEK